MREVDSKIYSEDEIDLRELLKTIYKKRFFLIIFSSLITIASIVYAYNKQNIYEVKSNIQIGFIGNDEKRELIDNPSSIVKRLTVVFEVDDKMAKEDSFTSEVSSISLNKKVENFIEVKTEGISNEEALIKNREVLTYLQNLYQPRIDLITKNILNKIEEKKRIIKNIKEFEIKNIEHQLLVIEEQKLKDIDKKIDIIKTQDIKKIEKEIENIKSQKIVKINEKIKLYNSQILPSIENKINFHTKKLEEYTKAVNDIVNNIKKDNDSSFLTISSIQMVNYQNLILDSQNKIEDLNTSKKTIEVETIPALVREKQNLKDIVIRDLKLKIKNLKNITLVDLEKEKQNIKNDTLRKLKHKINVQFVNKELKINQEIELLKFKLSKNYMQNSSLVGKYIIKDGPSKPKKKLIIIVSFVTSFILGIFIIFILEFIGKKEEKIL